ncbi:hypothetical protein RclHR1_00640001, partial [Rhizophagus clarus]
WDCHEKCLNSSRIVNLHGFTKNPDTLNYMDPEQYINSIARGPIITGLLNIHEQNLIHCDFHDDNILNHEGNKNMKNTDTIYISDLGLCQPVKSLLKKHDIYEVIPFMAPEVLRGKPYTSASDIYSFSMIMWEFTSGISPFYDRAHDLQLCSSICRGERPEIIENTPQCYVDLMKKCWDVDPFKKPPALEVRHIIANWIFRFHDNESEELKSNIMEFINAPIGNNILITESHPQACYKSRLLDFTSKNLNEILENGGLCHKVDDESSEDLNESVKSDCLDCIIDNTKSLGNGFRTVVKSGAQM